MISVSTGLTLSPGHKGEAGNALESIEGGCGRREAEHSGGGRSRRRCGGEWHSGGSPDVVAVGACLPRDSGDGRELTNARTLEGVVGGGGDWRVQLKFWTRPGFRTR